jgi:Flp pilus assembly protein TadB
MTIAVVAAVLAAALWPVPASARGRLRDLGAEARSGRARPGRGGDEGRCGSAHGPGRRLLLFFAAGAGVVLLLLSSSRLAAGAAVLVGVLVLRRRRAGSTRPAELAVVLDLLSGCLSGGAALPDGLEAAAAAAGPRLGADLAGAAGRLRAGDPPEVACAGWLAVADLAPLARTLVRSTESGAAVAADVGRLSARVRAEERVAAQQRIARASVWVVLPVGLCFLPAFLLVGVVPIALGLFQRLH